MDEMDVLDPQRIERAIAFARDLQERARELQTPAERRQQAELDRMIQRPADKVALLEITDQAFRASTPSRSADQLVHVLDVQGIPRFFSRLDRTLLRGFQSFGRMLPGVAVPLAREKMHHETANVILPAEPDLLAEHLRARYAEGFRMNVNFLGEALLGEAEAGRRLDAYARALEDPDLEVMSVKISTIFSQISSIAREATIETLTGRMERLYRTALRERFRRPNGEQVSKLVYLDMEEARDMSITVEVFLRTLDRPGLGGANAGLALQAYLPESFAVQRRITGWARRRVADGGSPITLRIVKGANMEMERVEAAIAGWPQAPFRTKIETDASYKRMLEYGLRPENAGAVRIGIASHNLFDVAWALVLAEERGVEKMAQFEMLEGMANHQRRALFEKTGDILLYAPACPREHFVNAIGYLIRRLDENTGKDNFLRHAFRLTTDSDDWRCLEGDFRSSFDRIGTLSESPRRTQDRHREPTAAMPAERPWWALVNEPDTDWSLPHHAEWARNILTRWQTRAGDEALAAPLVIAGQEIGAGRRQLSSNDPSRPGIVASRHLVATGEDVDRAVACARNDPDGWRQTPASERREMLSRVAGEIRRARSELMGIAAAEGGKVLVESDPEVSEAVDFCELYGRAAEWFAGIDHLHARGLGVVAVVPPWNFPIAIPCGGVAAALAAGNTVILKPAPETVATAWLLCQCFWNAGVSRRTLQFLPAEDSEGATRLVTHAGIDAVVFTGGTDTARHLLDLDPAMNLLAETGGKNAIIVTAMADRDLAVKHAVASAFGHAGQKCSAASLLVLEREVFEDAGFREALCDAAASLTVGPVWDPRTRVGPLIRPPAGPLEQALTTLEEGESWALQAEATADNPALWAPAIKWNVLPGGFTHRIELFGPVLGVMCARDLHDAIDLVNATGYGLTSGLESLDAREHEIWQTSLRAGNLYANRAITGAIVLRQPFGGIGKSSFGPGLKAGGPNTVVPLMRFDERSWPEGAEQIADDLVNDLLAALDGRSDVVPDEREALRAAARSGSLQWERELSETHDHARLLGQDNLRLYRPAGALRIRVDPEDSWLDIFVRTIAARTAGCRITVSTAPGAAIPAVTMLHEVTESWAAAIELLEESDEELAVAIRDGQADRVRFSGHASVPEAVRRAANDAGIALVTAPVLLEGRIELLWAVREQSLSRDTHRYGNLARRADEPREPTI